jgi:hypothetical protein
MQNAPNDFAAPSQTVSPSVITSEPFNDKKLEVQNELSQDEKYMNQLMMTSRGTPDNDSRIRGLEKKLGLASAPPGWKPGSSETDGTSGASGSGTDGTSGTTSTTGDSSVDGFGISQSEYDEVNKGVDEEFEKINSAFEDMKNTRDLQLQNQISQIQSMYEQRRKEQAELNNAILQTQTQAGIRSGGNRYAAEIQGGMLSKVEQTGIDKIKALDSEEQQLIMQAQLENNEENFAMMIKNFEMARQVRMDKNQAIKDLRDAAVQQNSMILQKSQQLREQQRFEMEVRDYERKTMIEDTGMIAGNLIGQDAEGNLTIPSSQEIEAIATELGVDPNFLMSSVRTKYQELAKLSQEEVKRELDIMKLQKDLKEEKMSTERSDYERAIANGEFEGSFMDYISAKSEASSSGTAAGKGEEGGDISHINKKTPFEELSLDAQALITGGIPSISSLPYGDRLRIMREVTQAGYTAVLSPPSQKDKANAADGSRAIEKIKELILDENGDVDKSKLAAAKAKKGFGLGTNELMTAISQAQDVVTRLRTGAALNIGEQKFYESLMPQLLDDAATTAYKLDSLQEFYDSFAYDAKFVRSSDAVKEGLGETTRDYTSEYESIISHPNFGGEDQKWLEKNLPVWKNEGYTKEQIHEFVTDELGEKYKMSDQPQTKWQFGVQVPFNNVGGDTNQASKPSLMSSIFNTIIPKAAASEPVITERDVQVYESQGKPVSTPTTILNGMKVITKAVAPNLQKFADNCVFFGRSIVPNIPTGAISVAGRKEGIKKAEAGGYGGFDLSKARVGDALHSTEGDVGHTMVIKGETPTHWILKEANYKPGQITEGRQIAKNDPKLIGWIRPKGNVSYKDQKGEGRNEGIEEQVTRIARKSPVFKSYYYKS